ncbi:MAG: TIGR02452 family protein, partial [Eubacteriales bacterium]|nr:TIGR02452 family protein [Eubacteriales bacterium]
FQAAAANGANLLVLGAFGCGAFCNNPAVVARAYREVLDEYAGYFDQVVFAVYCTPRSMENYEVFRRMLG